MIPIHGLMVFNSWRSGPPSWGLLGSLQGNFANDKQASGRQSVPYVLLYYLPVNANPNLKMSYAGAVELMRGTAEVNRVIEISEAEELEGIEAKLKGED